MKTTKTPKAPEKAETEVSPLVNAAKAVGSAAGKVAALVGATGDAKPRAPKPAKLQKKNRHRLPRRQKKAVKVS
jgi:hypothetical protein